MKILFVCNQYTPFKIDCGASQRSYFIVRALQKLGSVDIYILSNETIENNQVFVCPPKEFSRIDYLRNKIYRFWPFSIFYLNQINSNCKSAFHSLYKKNKYDLVVFRYMQTYLLCGAPNVQNMYLDVDDVPWDILEQFAAKKNYSYLRKAQFRFKYTISKYHGQRLKNRFNTMFYSNEQDAIKYKGTYLPNIPYIIHRKKEEEIKVIPHSLLFVGWMKHTPNLLGVDHFILNIWPQILHKYPDAIFNIVGQGLSPEFYEKWNNFPNIKILGYVESLEMIYNTSEIIVCPIYTGSGSNIKVVEALAYKKLCVISKFALRGYDNTFIDRQDLFVCNTDEDYINSICYAFENKSIAEKISNSGYSKVMKNFSENRLYHIFKIATENINTDE